MIGFNGKYLAAAAIGDMRITAMSQGDKILLWDWLLAATKAAILSAFGAEGAGVIRATNAYLNGLATTDREKAQRLADYINEDPMLVCSIVETSKTRWLVGSGAAYITTDIIPTQGSYARTLCKVISAEEYPWTDIFGCRNGANNKAYFVSINVSTQVINIAINTQLFNPALSFTFGEEIDIALDTANSKAYANGVEVAIARVETPSYPMKLFTQNNAGNQAARNTRAIAVMEYKDATQNAKFIPHLHGGVAGMLDLVSLDFYPNANTEGAFTIALTDKA